MGKKIIKRLTSEEIEEQKIINDMIKTNKEEKKKDINGKKYILLYYATDGEDPDKEDIKSFEIITGRKETYDFIKNMIESIDIHKSKVLSDTVTYNKAITVYEFMKYCSQFMEKPIDIEDYNYGDID